MQMRQKEEERAVLLNESHQAFPASPKPQGSYRGASPRAGSQGPGDAPHKHPAHPCIEVEVFFYCHVVEENVMLGTQAQAAADQNHVLGDLVAIDIRLPTRWRVQTWEERDTAISAQG